MLRWSWTTVVFNGAARFEKHALEILVSGCPLYTSSVISCGSINCGCAGFYPGFILP
jgi:hypothetical protein